MASKDDQGKVPSVLGMFHRSSSLSTAMLPFDGDDDSRSGVRHVLSRFFCILSPTGSLTIARNLFHLFAAAVT